MILLWGAARDSALVAVRTALSRMRARTVFLDQAAVLSCGVELRVHDTLEGHLWFPDGAVELDSVGATYVRTYDWTRLRAIARAGIGTPQWSHAQRFHQVMWSWTDLAPCRVVNRPALMASNSSKPYQCDMIRSMGFRTPATMLTTSPEHARAFLERHGIVIYKSISGVRSMVSRLHPAQHDRLDDVSTCPTQFQEYVAGDDHRVHVVGDEVFCVRVVTEADDYRYAHRAGHTLEVRPVTLPDDCAQRCRELAGALELPVAGIDLRRTPEGEWCCFEVNPSPAFTFYDREPHEPVARAIAQYLAEVSHESG